MNNKLVTLVERMNEFAELEHDASVSIVGKAKDSVDVEVRLCSHDDRSDEGKFVATIRDVGQFLGHEMVEILTEPSIIICSRPDCVMACLIEV